MSMERLLPSSPITVHTPDRQSGPGEERIFWCSLKNNLPYTGEKNILGHTKNITNLHTHGLHVSPNPPADSMMVQLHPGEIYDYNYCMDFEEPGHLNFYHPHVHGVVAEQYWGGLAGPLVVEDETPALSGLETHIMVLKDLTLSGSVPEPYTSTIQYMHGKEGNLVMVNGQVNPVLNIQPGQVQRWQIVNACNARFFNLAIENHTINLIGTDGGLLDKPYPVSSILLSPGERIDILVKANQTKKSYRFLSLSYNRGGMSNQQQVTLLTLSYKGSPVNNSPRFDQYECQTGCHEYGRFAATQTNPEHDAGQRIHQRPDLPRHGQCLHHHVTPGGLGGMGDRQPERHGSPFPPARELGPSLIHHRWRCRLCLPLHQGPRLEGCGHRPQMGER